MPATGQLRWFEVSDFKGLWTNGGKFLMPADHAQVMSGCLPQKAGGLRAFYLPTLELDAAGLENSSSTYTHTVRGLGILPEVANGNHYHLILSNGNQDYGLWARASGQLFGADELRWVRKTAAYYNGVSAFLSRPSIVTFTTVGIDIGGSALSGGEQYLCWPANWRWGNAGTNFPYQTLVSTSYGATPTANNVSGTEQSCGPITTHQNRVVMGAENAIIGSAPGDLSLNPAPIQIVAAQEGINGFSGGIARVAWLLPIPPSDLLVGMLSGAVFNVQGSLADPTIRELGRWGIMAPQRPVNTPYGPVVVLPSMGAAVLGTDGSVQSIAEALDPDTWTVDLTGQAPHVGYLSFLGGYLFAPNLTDAPDIATANPAASAATERNNGALVYDFSTGSWFTSVHPSVMRCINPRFMDVGSGLQNSGLFVATGEAIGKTSPSSRAVITRYPLAAPGYYSFNRTETEHLAARSWKFSWTSAPFRDPDGRQVEVQEIQVGTLGWNDSGTIKVTVRGASGETDVLSSHVPEGRTTHRLPARLRADYVEVTVESTNDEAARLGPTGATSEAPMIEFVRVGYQPGHRRQSLVPAGAYATGYRGGY